MWTLSIFLVCEIFNFTYFFEKIQDKLGKIWYYFSEEDLKATLEFGTGLGIAAPQIGINKRIIVIGAKKENIEKYNLRNWFARESKYMKFKNSYTF